MEKYYITTAIAYTSSKPHIGNTYEIVLADAIARHKRLHGFDVYFQTGTDEHGEKIEQKALQKGIEPQAYVDDIASQVKKMWDVMDTSYDKFVRTTDKHHEEVVKHIFQKLYDQGDIYLSNYEGLYCTDCEAFFTESQLIDGKCPDCNREVHKTASEAYFFRMSKYQDKLMSYYDEHPDFIEPIARKNEMVNNFLKPGLQDLCVSRTTFDWGVKVPFNDKHVVYVWIDALSNYISFLGYDTDKQSDEFNKYWPADLHLVGKDIIRFHVIYWPIILMALGLPLPKKIFGHPWMLFDNDKMSKSKGNVMYADDLVNLFGVDAIRYYCLHEIPFANDGNITYSLIIDRINSDLANNLGNLVNRVISMGHKYFSGHVENKKVIDAIDSPFVSKINSLENIVNEKMDKLEVGNGLEAIMNLFSVGNKYIDDTTPWVLAKDEDKKDRLETIIYNLLELIRVSAIELEPFLPSTSKEILNQLNIHSNTRIFESTNEYNLNAAKPLFIRIDKEAKIKEINE